MVIDTDGSAFITKAEFDSLKNNFQAQIDNYNSSLDSKIDGAIASYLSGIKMSSLVNIEPLYDYDGYTFIGYPTPTKNDLALWGVTGWVNDPAFNPWPSGFRCNFQNSSYSRTCGWVCQSCENRWGGGPSNYMKAVYEQSQESAAMRSGYYFKVADRTTPKQYINSINYIKAKVEEYNWGDGTKFIFHRNNSVAVPMGTAREWAVTGPTSVSLECYPATKVGEAVSWQLNIQLKKTDALGGGTAAYSYYVRMPFNDCATDEVYTDLTHSSFGFIAATPADFSLVLCDDVNGPDLKSVAAQWNYAVTAEEGNTLVDLGFSHSVAGGKYYTGQKIVATANINVFNKNNAKSFISLYSNKINKETREDVELYAGVPFMKSTDKGVASVTIQGQSAPVDILIKDSKFTGWTKAADAGSAIELKNESGATVTQTPSSGNTIKLTFPVDKNKIYYYKLGTGGGIKIIGNIEITKEN